MFTRTLVFQGNLVNGKQLNVPCPPATNGVIIQVKPSDTLDAKVRRRKNIKPHLDSHGAIKCSTLPRGYRTA